MFRFEKLDAWNRAMEWARAVYGVTASFPADERFGLTSQRRRAAVSVPSNLAEGSGRSSNAEFARFVEMTYCSLMEAASDPPSSSLDSRLSSLDSPNA